MDNFDLVWSEDRELLLWEKGAPFTGPLEIGTAPFDTFSIVGRCIGEPDKNFYVCWTRRGRRLPPKETQQAILNLARVRYGLE